MRHLRPARAAVPCRFFCSRWYCYSRGCRRYRSLSCGTQHLCRWESMTPSGLAASSALSRASRRRSAAVRLSLPRGRLPAAARKPPPPLPRVSSMAASRNISAETPPRLRRRSIRATRRAIATERAEGRHHRCWCPPSPPAYCSPSETAARTGRSLLLPPPARSLPHHRRWKEKSVAATPTSTQRLLPPAPAAGAATLLPRGCWPIFAT
ncbi:unnamed protein product [Ectocarpus sp. 12 AP-2014]